MNLSKAEKIHQQWFKNKNWKAFQFQKEALNYYLQGYSGLLNAPTGSGKTYALWIPILIDLMISKNINSKGLKVLWITPVRALVNDIKLAMQQASQELGLHLNIASRTGDTDQKEKSRQKKQLPHCLITTPESVHIMLASKGYTALFKNLQVVVVDEWHELLGNKRGVAVELALSRLRTVASGLRTWGISATIGNLDQAMEVLIPSAEKSIIIRAEIDKKIEIISVIPDEIEKFPWGGHLGLKLLDKVLPIIHRSKTTLLFTNTRSQAEIWYRAIVEADPSLAGLVGLHHGSLSSEIRTWVEDSLHKENLKIVVCTSSLDLGVDFRPVDTVIQVGGPKGVSRFVQRAGRSGHRPGEVSHIYFVPAHSLELIEAAALRSAIEEEKMEDRTPVVRAFDVLCQFLVTLAISEGFTNAQALSEIRQTFAYRDITIHEWNAVITFITTGGSSLVGYTEFSKVILEEGLYKVLNKKIAMMHRMSIGTIVSDAMMQVKYLNGSYIGSVEEYFITKVKPGDVFFFGGKTLELIMIRHMEAIVRRSNKKSTNVPQYMGGRMPFSSRLSAMIRHKLTEAIENNASDIELAILKPLFEKQKEISMVPMEDELLIEYFESKDGYHVFCYTFEGRFVNEGIAALMGYRISKSKPFTFSISMTDYGFELLSDKPIPIEEVLEEDIFSTDNLLTDILSGLNSTEMARRKFRDIAHIAGLIFSGYPGKQIKNKHLQASARNFFDVFRDYEPDQLLLRQAYEEVLFEQLDEARLREALKRINQQKIHLKYISKPSPFSFPIMVERIREKLTNEKIEDRVERLLKSYKLES